MPVALRGPGDEELSGPGNSKPAAGAIINCGAVIAVLLAIPGFFIGMYGAIGVVTGKKVCAGLLGALWAYAAISGTYELMRRKFHWEQGRKYRDHHLLAGMLAVAVGLIVSGALHETMPLLALVPALSAVKQASNQHPNRLLTVVHAAVLLFGIVIGAWFYDDGVIGLVLLERIAALP